MPSAPPDGAPLDWPDRPEPADGRSAGQPGARRGLADDGGAPDLDAGLAAALAFHWHPVAEASDLVPGGRPLAVRVLGRDLVLARLAGGAPASVVDPAHGCAGSKAEALVALDDRCPHRSTR